MCKGFQQNERDRLKIKAFYLHLSFSSPTKNALPDCLTLHYLPRISESPLEINESKIRSDAPGFVTLHRVVSPETKGVIYGSRDRVKASEGVRFEIYIADVKILRGIFGKDGVEENWRIDCKSMLENDDLHVKGAEVCVAVEGRASCSAAEVITEKVEMTVKRSRTRRKSCFQKLEEIPEQREVENELEESTCCCSECEGEEDSDNGETVEAAEEEAETEGVGWALDVGLWVMCLGVGVGYLVSRASSKRLRRRRFITYF